MRRNALGRTPSQCLLCGDRFGLLGAQSVQCIACLKLVCQKCAIEAWIGVRRGPGNTPSSGSLKERGERTPRPNYGYANFSGDVFKAPPNLLWTVAGNGYAKFVPKPERFGRNLELGSSKVFRNTSSRRKIRKRGASSSHPRRKSGKRRAVPTKMRRKGGSWVAFMWSLNVFPRRSRVSGRRISALGSIVDKRVVPIPRRVIRRRRCLIKSASMPIVPIIIITGRRVISIPILISKNTGVSGTFGKRRDTKNTRGTNGRSRRIAGTRSGMKKLQMQLQVGSFFLVLEVLDLFLLLSRFKAGGYSASYSNMYLGDIFRRDSMASRSISEWTWSEDKTSPSGSSYTSGFKVPYSSRYLGLVTNSQISARRLEPKTYKSFSCFFGTNPYIRLNSRHPSLSHPSSKVPPGHGYKRISRPLLQTQHPSRW